MSAPEDYLLKHTYKNVWCTPEQDKQANLQLPRVTPFGGVWVKFDYQWRSFKLPSNDPSERFHVYQIGQQFPELLGLLNKRGVWINAKEAMEANCLTLDVYNSKGVIVPRSLCWYIISGDKNILLAVCKPNTTPKIRVDIDLENEPLFMRVYTNAYFNSESTVLPDNGIIVHSTRPKSLAEFNAFQALLQTLPTYGGKFYYVNGKRVNTIDLVCAKVGDYVECVFDASVKREAYFKVKELQEFESDLDPLHKFLLHYAGNSNIIDYQDDVDVYIGTRYDNNRWMGVYLHKNDSRTLRMVTHRDYSVPVIRINGAQAANTFLKDTEIEVRLTIRRAGYARPLVFENQRIFELYKLPDSKLVDALLGINAVVPVWTATALENSAYTKVMRQKQGAITKEMVQQAYGYNAISVLLGNTPARIIPFNGQKVVIIPPGLVGCCTVYEYNEQGRLLFYTQHTVDNTYSCQAPDAAFVECIYGLGGESLDTQDNTVTGLIDPSKNYRFYAKDTLVSNWVDRTAEPHYLIQGNQYTWVGMSRQYNRVLSNKRHLAYTFEMAPLAGVFEFDLIVGKDGQYSKLDFPLGELDLFFNGYSLIEGLDYLVKGARVIITTKKYFDNTLTKQSFTVRYTGFCNKDLSRTPAPEVGFVYHGVLSANNRYNIHEDKVLRIVCAGGVKLKDQIKFAEDGVTSVLENITNGAPYAIRDIVVPMNNYLIGGESSNDETYKLRAASEVIDKEVSDYLSLHLPQNSTDKPNVISSRYPVYSPFLSRIIDDLLNGVLQDSMFYSHFGDEWLAARLANYLYLLEYDLSSTSKTVDNRYVVIHPHPYPDYVTLDAYQYRIVQRAAKLYTRNVELSSTLNVQ